MAKKKFKKRKMTARHRDKMLRFASNKSA